MHVPATLVRRLVLCTGALALLLTAGACSRQLPTAPAGTSAGARPIREGAQPARYGGGEVDSEVVVTLQPGVDGHVVATDYGATLVGGEVYERQAAYLPPAGQTALDFAQVLAADPRVITSEQNSLLESAETRQQSFAFDDGLGSAQTFLEQPTAEALGLDAAHAVGGGHGVRVAIIDTGADLTHPALAGRIVGDYDLVGADYDASETTDGIDNDGDGHIDEAYGHGTHVAGLVALAAPDAELLIVRALDSDGRGDILCVAAGIRWAVAHGAKVINMSLGSLKASDAVQDAMEEAENAGVVLVASAGNWGLEQPQEFPARSSHAIAIAACNANGEPASFTSYARYVQMSAPGVGVRSAFPGGGWRLWSGTSMSAPLVSGAAAVLLGLHPTWTTTDVMTRLGDSVRPLQNVPQPMHNKLGAGMLDLAAAVRPDMQSVATDPGPGQILRRGR